MLSHGVEFGKYGVQTTFYWSFEDATAVDAPFVGTAPLAVDIFLSKDGGAPANATNAMTAIGNGIYSHVLTATEMQATRLSISVYDQTPTEIFKPAFRVILTKLQLGQVDVDATQIGGNTSGIKSTGVGTSHGVELQGGATGGHGLQGTGGATNGYGMRLAGGSVNGGGLLATAPVDGPGIWALGNNTASQEWGAITAFGNNSGTSPNCHALLLVGAGTGAGAYIQGAVATHNAANGEAIYAAGATTVGNGISVIAGGGNSAGISAVGRGTSYGFSTTHASDNSLMTNIFDTLEGTEPSAAIATNASMKTILQNLKRRFFNLVTQTSSVQTMFKDDSVTSLQTMSCSNDGTTQSKGKAT
jgi:hypothetical protein